MRLFALFLAVPLMVWSCSLVYRVRVQNDTDSPITLAFKIRPMGYQGIFFEEAKAFRGVLGDTTIVMDRADSVITFTLQPGQRADLGDCRECSHARTVDEINGTPGTHRMNLYWLRLTRNGTTTTYTPDELLRTAKQERLSLILLSEMR